jgi:hypothetical protein
VDAVADFLTNPETKPPFTLSVEGAWGSGKSSFMIQLKKLLESKYHQKSIEFNAWRYDKVNSLAAAFATEFLRQLSKRVGFRKRCIAAVKLYLLRFNWKDGWVTFARTVVTWLAILIGTFWLAIYLTSHRAEAVQHVVAGSEGGGKAPDEKNLSETLWSSFLKFAAAGSWGAGVITSIMLLAKLKEAVGDPLAADLKQFNSSPDYESQVGFMARFHEDFSKIVKCYVASERVFVFIDDLDRCEIPKAAELVQGLNLMISEAEQLVFIIGMDRDKVAASLAVKFEKVLPYLAAASGRDAEQNKLDARFGLEFGYNFVEKFVQLPFRVPQPRNEIKRLLSSLSTDSAASQAPAPGVAEKRRRSTLLQINFGNESPRVIEIGNAVAPALDYNPRRLKGFLNLFRLRTFIAASTGLFDEPDTGADGLFTPLTLEQLAKFVVISLKWPLLIQDLVSDHLLLKDLENRAISNSSPPSAPRAAVAYWVVRYDLMHFLTLGLDIDAARWSMSKVNIGRLLEISPATRRNNPVKAASTKSVAPSAASPAAVETGLQFDSINPE